MRLGRCAVAAALALVTCVAAALSGLLVTAPQASAASLVQISNPHLDQHPAARLDPHHLRRQLRYRAS